MAVIMDGKVIANDIQNNLKNNISNYLEKNLRKPHLVVFLVGTEEASKVYVNHKIKVCEKLEIQVSLKTFNENVSEQDLLTVINKVNNDDTVDAILVQLPLPKHLNKNRILDHINARKDADGLHYINAGKLFQGLKTIAPCTPLGVIKLLEAYNIDVFKKTVTMVGTSNLVGKPLAIMLHHLGATVTLCNENTVDLKKHTIGSDIVISAVGVANLIDETMVKANTIVVDAAIVRNLETNRICGDIKFDMVKEKVSYITPVPGGIGPMTIAMLVTNVYDLYVINMNKKNLNVVNMNNKTLIVE
ncbi:bifunctional 5,10-methylenetetrahydrofolate dehydrogenase/5,10-methenyltetrahydrofolate cyclohydrolase [Spiroplasma endosymbiont of 'Nebria riversi']|uniref:bifunctional 5,10-methylenetetrahydrofolate dehydrogenase/5,10-methenyltetrahydrofolate cyclohydrolase n=1 Tax=Spiroplasma endosymbiont of 'Nebria riversi' TaxID=2792084 RepID=UPI001C04E748|nr:bifunctional 5,10-methylenetetrahydrofolate dehydrogenase/5,10-methenyltetrahydrofolate cyclohydrolase [Spiroplasma endosymbiont of 'Nebria riversi']